MIKGKIISFLYSCLNSFPFLYLWISFFLSRLNVIGRLNTVHRLLHLPEKMSKYVHPMSNGTSTVTVTLTKFSFRADTLYVRNGMK